MKQSRLADLVRTLPRLGWRNLLRVAVYRLALRAGLYRRLMPIGDSYGGPFWSVPPAGRVEPPEPLRHSIALRAQTDPIGLDPVLLFRVEGPGFPARLAARLRRSPSARALDSRVRVRRWRHQAGVGAVPL